MGWCALGQREAWRDVHLLGDEMSVRAVEVAQEGTTATSSQGLGRAAGGLEKRGLRARLEEVGGSGGDGSY